ncbi:MAG: hypothetical protein WBQ34_02890 [Candidatus Acidiferrales bacterium]
MTRIEKRVICIAGITIVVLAALLWLNYLWANVPPPRPANVPPTATYYGGLATTFPYPKRGQWVNCWFDSERNADLCRVTSFDGRLVYQGIYLSYPRQTPLPETDLLIDSKTMNRAQEQIAVEASGHESSEPGIQGVPLVYLRDGDVLMPAKAYEAGKKRLEELQKAHSPYAPPAEAPAQR